MLDIRFVMNHQTQNVIELLIEILDHSVKFCPLKICMIVAFLWDVQFNVVVVVFVHVMESVLTCV